MNVVYELNIIIHIVAALLCLILGAFLLIELKGDEKHKKLGKYYVALMFVVVISSVFIKQLNSGKFSWLHWLSLFTFLSLVYAIVMIKRSRVKSHRNAMSGIYIGLFVAGILSVSLPGRYLTS